ncbi:hypothetical protein SEA_APIARY_68 [Rhodococcus phage Apiary]|nr:hypothetical protein SEA_BRAXOADDIE_68 [Rhodococcus phage Braxoaddie]WNM64991.1 hypothetical protein SEA_MASELOP_68 [Rhodococcus phage Maselop]WNM67452.1 hypothetical protein SEA_POLYYUKI_68 [Rhodococcus phage Polyyuki]WNM69876.1 hypothetical protein SEA_APIARY_68 [Rhodococcus phage Apiary]
MTDIYLTQADAPTSPDAQPIVQARPLNGQLIHAVRDRPLDRQNSSLPLVYARALCGVTGRDAWGGGGMVISGPRTTGFEIDPLPFRPSPRGDRTTCKKCSRIYREEFA